MPTNSPPQPPTSSRGGWCCLLFAAVPVVWFLGVLVLPEWAFWYPVWLGAAIWHGPDGQGGISALFG